VEVDITHTDINKLNLYASMDVPEFWRYNGQVLRIYQLQDHQYIEVENSPTFSRAIKEQLYQFLLNPYQTRSVASLETLKQIWTGGEKPKLKFGGSGNTSYSRAVTVGVNQLNQF